ncbi:uncharacterized protein si:ch211-151h10.2 isoform X1 [Astyanax mexicanus]|uniref:uncharacterized protein si:ch211-151h10.2 isoform X1 n=1 Tax=Astyanax mexicanus TaxID=7994 RepID=UPI0020CAB331|nr:uncharacterized protein si:ch211-151h10.2 isoform X1 [Astyanax mexicanus]
MPQLTTLNARGLRGVELGERREEEGGEEDGGTDGESDQDRTGGEQGQSQRGTVTGLLRLNWTHWSSWLQGLGPAAVLWLVVQEESPLYSSLSLLQAGGRLLQAVLIWTILALCTYLIRFLYHNKETYIQRLRGVSWISAEPIRENKPYHQQREQDAGHLVSVLSSVLDGFVVSVLQEPVSGESSLPQIRCLLTRLEVVFQALHKGSLSEGQSLQIKEEEEEVSEEDSSLRDRVKHIHTYLQDRVGALRCLLQVQDEYGGCLAEVQQGLQERWELLEDLHTRVTLQPDQHQNPEDPNTVLSDTESLYTQLGLFRRTVNECQTHLNSCTHLLQGLESRQKVLAETVGLTLDSTWIKDFVQSNSQQFKKVQENFLSLEQQTLTFVTHLRGLRAPGDSGGCDLEPVQTTPSSPLSSVPAYTAVLSTDSTDPHLDPDLDTKPPPRPSSKLSAMSCLCGVRRRK